MQNIIGLAQKRQAPFSSRVAFRQPAGRRPIRIKIVRFYIATARLFSAEVFGFLPFSE